MSDLENEIKLLIIESLDLEDVTVEDIQASEALFDDGLGLDSIDALELGLALKDKFDVHLDADSEVAREHFYSVETLAKFVRDQGRLVNE